MTDSYDLLERLCNLPGVAGFEGPVREAIHCQFKLPPSGGTDAGAIHQSRGGVLTGVVSVPLHPFPVQHLPSFRLRPHMAAPGRVLQGRAGGVKEPDVIMDRLREIS